jgi:hypothetical protein
MSLPKIQSSSKISTIGSKKLKIRAYTGKEEKAILMAKMQKDPQALIQTIIDVLSTCCDHDVSTLTQGEFERLFIDIRSISVSDMFEPNLACQHCKESTPVKIPARSLKDPETFVSELVLEVGKDAAGASIFVKLKTPTIGDLTRFSKDEESDMRIIHASTSSVYTSTGETFEFEYEEFRDWFESLTGVYMQAVLFVKDSPSVTYSKTFKCIHCKKDTEFKIEGLQSFLA